MTLPTTTLLAVTLLAPLAGAAGILLPVRRPSGATSVAATVWTLSAAGTSLAAGAGTLARVAAGARPTIALQGLPGLPLRVEATPLTALLSVLVATVGALVLVYAVGYLHGQRGRPRFFATMLLFVTGMQALVLAGDLVLLMAGWEVIGAASYLLIGFRPRQPGVPEAATRAFLTTRAADLGLYAAGFLLIAASGGTAIPAALQVTGPAALAASLLLLVAASGKSAQVPMNGWLQGAMVAPTPVSALLHSATLVASGAILLVRFAPLFPAPALLAVGLVGGVTAVVTGAAALAESDLKRLLAASTSSLYGLMFLAVAAGSPLAAVLLLLAHAAVKSSLFLGAGIFQHARGSTALSALRGVGRERPATFAGFVLAALALAGIPPLSLFAPKDALVAAAWRSPHAAALASLALAGILLTGAYLARAVRILGHEGPSVPTRSVAGMAWMLAGFGGLLALGSGLAAAYPGIRQLLGGELPEHGLATATALSAALLGLSLGWVPQPERVLGPLLPWARRGFVVAGGLAAVVGRPVLGLARACARADAALDAAVTGIGRLALRLAAWARRSDDHGIDRVVTGLAAAIVRLGRRLRTLQSGLIHRELALGVLGSAVLLATVVSLLLARPATP